LGEKSQERCPDVRKKRTELIPGEDAGIIFKKPDKNCERRERTERDRKKKTKKRSEEGVLRKKRILWERSKKGRRF